MKKLFLVLAATLSAACGNEGGDNSTIVATIAEAIPDPVFASFCSQNFDKNNDGKLSRNEIAAATAIAILLPLSTPDDQRMHSLEGIEIFSELKYLLVPEQRLTELDVSQNRVLERIECGGNAITELRLGENDKLWMLNCVNNDLTELDISHNPALERLWCYFNDMTELDISHNPALNILICGSQSGPLTLTMAPSQSGWWATHDDPDNINIGVETMLSE